ncbi:MAG TPA: DPP IV N-terminal domain-containing protein [Kofleriaceae bacterium]|nr:DPP IV N-terminal domain-containing protein [Kofleriaceae bacterium]
MAVALCALAACRGDAPGGNVPPSMTTAPAPADAAWPALDDSFIEQQTVTNNFQLGKPTAVWVAPDGGEVLFVRSGPRSSNGDLHAVSVATGQERVVVAAADLLGGGAETLSVEEKARRERLRQVTGGVSSFSASTDGARLLVPLSGRLFLHDRRAGTTRELDAGGGAHDPMLSPDGRSVSFTRDGDLFVLDVDRGGLARLTRRESPAIEHGVAEFVAQEEMHRRRGAWWSPDSAHIAFQRTDQRAVETLYIADATHPEAPPTAFHYPRAGAANAEVTLGIAPARGGRTVWVEWDRAAYPYLAAVVWPERGALTIVVQDRAQQDELVLAVDPRTGATRQLLREQDPAWVNLDDEMPRWLDDGSGFLWTTDRGGAWQLELRAPDGALVRALTPPELGYLETTGFDGARGAVWVRATGPSPLGSDLYRVPLAGGAPERVTDGGDHTLHAAARSGVHVLWSRDAAGVERWSVRREDGTEAAALRSVAEEPAFAPALELTTVEVDGRTYHASVVRPRATAPGRRYPVLLHIYGGPRHNHVVADRRAYLLDQWYADAGFIVVRTDARGTPRRGRAWERTVRGDLTTAPLEDQIAVLRALGQARPELDLEQVGVYGWSFGGTMSALAVMMRPDVFRAGLAGAPVTDWRDYDTYYTERYLGLPADDPAGYDRSSPTSYAARLTRPLLLVHGTTDDNVYFAHTLKLAQALFRARRPFEMLPLAGFTHMVPDPVVKTALAHRTVQFFRQHLAPPH